MDLFVCWANVWRSQVAEWFAKKLWKNVLSCAWVEARKEKYFNKPEKVVTSILLEDYNIDISNQEVFYPKDIKNNINDINNIYFLFDPKKSQEPDKDNLINWLTFWDYLDSIWRNYIIYEIEDPDAKDINTIKSIVDDLYNLINKIYLI